MIHLVILGCHSLTDNAANSSVGHISVVCRLIFDALYGYATLNLIKKPFMMVRGFKIETILILYKFVDEDHLKGQLA